MAYPFISQCTCTILPPTPNLKTGPAKKRGNNMLLTSGKIYR
jgi:hypothetical protein